MSQYKILILLAVVVFLGVACSKKEEKTVFNQDNEKKANPVATEEIKPAEQPATAPEATAGEKIEAKSVTLQTSLGDIRLEFYPSDAPRAVSNFIKLAEKGFYDGVIFHRVIPDFMIQGGDPLSKDADPNNDGTGGPGYMFADELNPAAQSYKTGYKKGVLAMANAGPNTNGSQFFIMLADYPLPNQYSIFGHVVSGQDVVDKIGAVKTTGAPNDRPLEKVVIKKVVIEKR